MTIFNANVLGHKVDHIIQYISIKVEINKKFKGKYNTHHPISPK